MFMVLSDSVLFLYLVLPCIFLSLCWLTEATDHAGSATICILLFLGLLQMFSDIHPFTYIINEPIRSALIAGVYVVCGVVYVWFKWMSYVNTAVRKINANRNDYGSTRDPESTARYLGYKSIPLKVSDYKSKIMGWMIYWPASAAWTILNDPIRRLFEAIYNKIAKSLQDISDKAFSDITKTK